ncbi:MAG: cytochrome c family protein, partial [Paracoccaceae bacterium]
MKKNFAGAFAAVVMLSAGTAFAADCDLKLGEKSFKACKACHKLEDGKNGVGPHLFGVVGRSVASVDGYKYSKGMVTYAEGDAVWDADRLD